MGKTVLPDDFAISAEMRAWADAKVPIVDVDREHETFCDYWRAHGRKMADWNACWRNWMRRAPKMGGALRSQDEMRVRALMSEYTAKGFRRAFVHESASMYQAAYEAWQSRDLPQRDTRGAVLQLVKAKRA